MRIAIGGLCKVEMERTIKACGYDDIQIFPMTDMEAMMKLRAKEVDYYFGVCHSGGGGAIAMMIGAFGYKSCCTIAMNGGKKATPEQINQYLDEGKFVFGFNNDSIERAVPEVLKCLINKTKG